MPSVPRASPAPHAQLDLDDEDLVLVESEPSMKIVSSSPIPHRQCKWPENHSAIDSGAALAASPYLQNTNMSCCSDDQMKKEREAMLDGAVIPSSFSRDPRSSRSNVGTPDESSHMPEPLWDIAVPPPLFERDYPFGKKADSKQRMSAPMLVPPPPPPPPPLSHSPPPPPPPPPPLPELFGAARNESFLESSTEAWYQKSCQSEFRRLAALETSRYEPEELLALENPGPVYLETPRVCASSALTTPIDDDIFDYTFRHGIEDDLSGARRLRLGWMVEEFSRKPEEVYDENWRAEPDITVPRVPFGDQTDPVRSLADRFSGHGHWHDSHCPLDSGGWKETTRLPTGREDPMDFLNAVLHYFNRKICAKPAALYACLLGLIPVVVATSPTPDLTGSLGFPTTSPGAAPRSGRSRPSRNPSADLLIFGVGAMTCLALVAGARYWRKSWKLPAPVMCVSSIVFYVLRNDADVSPKVAWMTFAIWSTANLSYVLTVKERLLPNRFPVYILASAILMGALAYVFAVLQEPTTTAIPMFVAFSTYVCKVALQSRFTCGWLDEPEVADSLPQHNV